MFAHAHARQVAACHCQVCQESDTCVVKNRHDICHVSIKSIQALRGTAEGLLLFALGCGELPLVMQVMSWHLDVSFWQKQLVLVQMYVEGMTECLTSTGKASRCGLFLCHALFGIIL